MPPRDLDRRRPRAVADVPDADPAAVAKAWLLELLRAVPLAQAGQVPHVRVAQEGPALCEALLAALASDAALDALTDAATGAAALTGATDAAGVVVAIEALRAAATEVLRAALPDPEARQAAELADRLAHACAVLLEGALAAAASGAARSIRAAPARPPAETPSRAAGPVRATAARPPAGAAHLVRPPYPAAAPPAPAHPDEPPHDAAIARRVDAYARDGRPFAVVLVEVEDADRLLAAQRDDEVDRALAAAEDAVSRALRPGDLLTREAPGRLWVTAPDTAGPAARDLAVRLAGAVAGAAALHGASLRGVAGLAVCPDDARDAEVLAGHAEEALFAARADGVPLV
jgi:GGDEF domain-containing protein